MEVGGHHWRTSPANLGSEVLQIHKLRWKTEQFSLGASIQAICLILFFSHSLLVLTPGPIHS